MLDCRGNHPWLEMLPFMGNISLHIIAQNIDYPDTVYSVYTDSTEYAVIHNMWKGNYHFTASCFGCSTYDLITSITGDTLLNIILTTGVTPPPTNLSVNPHTLLATWNPPRMNQAFFEENWATGTISTNAWTISAQTNWQMASGFGNPAPSIMFNWTPQANGYDQ